MKYKCSPGEIRMPEKLTKFPVPGTLWWCFFNGKLINVVVGV
jgi:hypothetical protein